MQSLPRSRRPRFVPFACLVAVAAVGIAGLAGCARTSTSPSDSSSASSSASSTTGTDTASPRPTSTTTATPIEGQCDTAKLSGSIQQGGGGAAGSVEVLLVLKNTGSSSCNLQGWPGVSFVGGGNGTQLGSPAELDRSKPHPTVQLAAGAAAQAPLRIAQALNYPQDTCDPKPADGFRVYPPGSTTSIFVTYPATACASTSVSLLTVGGLVPAQG
ncbi:DUF4232 domain-containing protein [Leifsonia sp. AG29]|uniref:DUF4232 domain-containing protein n=1 Tax=Leifsonia sp. AG29 TaxID=2598860 RepID=UPI00131C245C|nr:DUF4232 domain-containing protein [Leifsonia sp. AG29]